MQLYYYGFGIADLTTFTNNPKSEIIILGKYGFPVFSGPDEMYPDFQICHILNKILC